MERINVLSEIDMYLKKRKLELSESVLNKIEAARKDSIINNDEENANLCWCYKTIFFIQDNYIKIFNLLKNPTVYEGENNIPTNSIKKDNFLSNSLYSDSYEKAWFLLDNIDIRIGELVQNFDVGSEDNDPYQINFIKREVKQFIKLFPYKIFTSREEIVKKEVCSICGQTIKLRGGCNHKPGKLYMGELCYRIVKDLELIGIAFVRDPFDKYAFVKSSDPNFRFNYDLINETMKVIKSPFDSWYVDIIIEKKDMFKKKIGRNNRCPCGSGKKYKKCCMGTANELMEQYRITYLGSMNEFVS